MKVHSGGSVEWYRACVDTLPLECQYYTIWYIEVDSTLETGKQLSKTVYIPISPTVKVTFNNRVHCTDRGVCVYLKAVERCDAYEDVYTIVSGHADTTSVSSPDTPTSPCSSSGGGGGGGGGSSLDVDIDVRLPRNSKVGGSGGYLRRQHNQNRHNARMRQQKRNRNRKKIKII